MYNIIGHSGKLHLFGTNEFFPIMSALNAERVSYPGCVAPLTLA